MLSRSAGGRASLRAVLEAEAEISHTKALRRKEEPRNREEFLSTDDADLRRCKDRAEEEKLTAKSAKTEC